MLSFELRTDKAGTLQFMNSLQLITTGTSLGDVESLALYPAMSSHRGLTETELNKLGIGKGLVRLSVGLEAPMDLIADLQQAAARSVMKVWSRQARMPNIHNSPTSYGATIITAP
jgi:cystathionine beta-lyase/cystathionine gamma-synthase